MVSDKSVRLSLLIAGIVLISALSFVTISLDSEDSSAVIVKGMTISKNEKVDYDIEFNEFGILKVDGVFNAKLSILDSDGNTISKFGFNNATGFSIHYTNEGICIIGEPKNGSDSTGITILKGSIKLGSGNNAYTGYVYVDSDRAYLNNISDAVAANVNSGLVMSGTVHASDEIGFDSVASVNTVYSGPYSNNEKFNISGLLSNIFLDNSITVYKTEESLTGVSYRLTGTLSYIDRSGYSAAGLLLDSVVGKDFKCNHAVIIACSEDISSDNIFPLGGGKYLVGLTDSKYHFSFGNVTVSFAGLILQNEKGGEITPLVNGYTGKIDVYGGDISNMVIVSGVSLTICKDSDVYIDGITIGGSMAVEGISGTANSVITTKYGESHGTVFVSGKLVVKTLENLNVHGVYGSSQGGYSIVTLEQLLSNPGNKSATIVGSYVLNNSITIPSDFTLTNNGLLYVNEKATLTNNGVVSNNGGLVVCGNAHFYNIAGSIQSSKSIMAFGLITQKGSFNFSVYADVSYYDNITTRMASLPVMLENVTSGAKINIVRDVNTYNDAVLKNSVTLSTFGHKLTIGVGKTFTVNGILEVENIKESVGLIFVRGSLVIENGGVFKINSGSVAEVSDEGIIKNRGEMSVAGTLNASKMAVSGELKVTGTVVISDKLILGESPRTLPYDNYTRIAGLIQGDATVIVYGKLAELDLLKVFAYHYKTEFYVGGQLFATEYDSAGKTITPIIPKINGIGFIEWQSKSGNPIPADTTIGTYEKVYALVTDKTFTVTFKHCAGVTYIIDETISVNDGEVKMTYGVHVITVEISPGYSGNPILRVGNQIIQSGSEFTLESDISVQASGVIKQGSDESNTLILTLATVLVLMTIVVGILLFMLNKKNKAKSP